MTDARQRLGRRAEREARTHLERAGLRLVVANWKAPPHPGSGGHGGELDLVMRDGDVLVFVEVRAGSPSPSRAGTSFAGGAAYTVGPAKRRRLIALASLYLRGADPKPRASRFDVVAVTRRGLLGYDVRWYKNAFSA